MKRYKSVFLLLVAGLSLLAGKLLAADAAVEATPKPMKIKAQTSGTNENPKPAKAAKAHKPKATSTPSN